MEEENKNVNVEEPTEVLGNTGVIEPVTEEPVTEPVIETPVESPVMEAPVENPVETEPVAEMAQVETKAEEVPTETVTPMPEPASVPAEPVQETPVAQPVEAPEAPKKKSKLPLILLLLLVLAAGGFAVWYFVLGGNGAKKEEPKKEEEQKEEKSEEKEEEKPVELTQTEIDSITDKVKNVSDYFAPFYEKNLTGIDNQRILIFAIKTPESKDTFTKEEIEERVYNYLGKMVTINHEDWKSALDNHESIFVYSDGVYTRNPNHGGHGGLGFNIAYAKPTYVSGEKKGNKVTVDYKILYTLSCADTCSGSNFYISPTEQTTPLITYQEGSDGTGGVKAGAYEKYKDQIPVTEFTFEEENGNFILTGVSIKK